MPNERPLLRIGDGNAVSGGVNINNTTNIIERSRSTSEIINDKENAYVSLCRKALSDLIVTNEEEAKLESLRLELGISKDRADELLDSVRQIVMKTFQADVLTGVAKIKADQFHEAILTNNIVSIKQLLPAIETLVSNNRNEEIHFKYYMSLAAIDPKRCIETYENSRTDDYWLTYWTCLSYAKQNMPEAADRLLMELEIKFHHIPSDNTVILAAACASVSQNIESAKSYLNSVQHNYSSLLQDLYTVLYQYIKPSKKATVSKFYDECLLLPNNEEDRDRKSAALTER